MLEFNSKICRERVIKGRRELVINGKREIIVPVDEEKMPYNGLFLGENLILENLCCENGLEIGAGKYAPASFCLASFYPEMRIDMLEIQKNDVNNLRRIIALNRLNNRQLRVIKGDLFQPLRKKHYYNIIFSNIAQMPLAPGKTVSVHDHGGEDGWLLLDKIISNSPKYLKQGGFLALMVFDFLGVEKRSNHSIPSLIERLENNQFKPITMASYLRKMRVGGETYKSLKYIRCLFPEAVFYNAFGKEIRLSSDLINDQPIYLKFYFVLSKLGPSV